MNDCEYALVLNIKSLGESAINGGARAVQDALLKSGDGNNLVLLEVATQMVNIISHYEKDAVIIAAEANKIQARRIINSLSYSELEAAMALFGELTFPGGLIVAGRLAEGAGMARSTVASAIRKLEGAGAVETRSLGVKGTYIRILNECLAEELAHMR